MTALIQPVSWLRLERYHLGELTPAEAAEVERALAASPETRACLDEIRKPVALRPLPAPARAVPAKPSRKWRARWPILSIAAAAACLSVILLHPAPELVPPPHSVRVKGGDVALGLVRERNGTVDTAPTSFAAGDRFKVLVSCPAAFDGPFDVVVVQDGVAAFPFSAASPVVCGNGVPLPGAFTVTGATKATVCVTWARGPERRAAVERRGIEAIRGEAACVTLEPLPREP